MYIKIVYNSFIKADGFSSKCEFSLKMVQDTPKQKYGIDIY
jgi:hypothetical protein